MQHQFSLIITIRLKSKTAFLKQRTTINYSLPQKIFVWNTLAEADRKLFPVFLYVKIFRKLAKDNFKVKPI